MTRTITPTHVLLNQVTLAASASSVTFSSIPQNYSDFTLVFSGTASQRAELGIRINSDSGTNYPYVIMRGNGTSVSTAASTVETYMFSSGRVDSGQSTQIIQFMDYSATDKHKTLLWRDSAAQEYVTACAGRWANTNAISRIDLSFPFGGTFNSGCTFSLYGVYA